MMRIETMALGSYQTNCYIVLLLDVLTSISSKSIKSFLFVCLQEIKDIFVQTFLVM